MDNKKKLELKIKYRAGLASELRKAELEINDLIASIEEDMYKDLTDKEIDNIKGE